MHCTCTHTCTAYMYQHWYNVLYVGSELAGSLPSWRASGDYLIGERVHVVVERQRQIAARRWQQVGHHGAAAHAAAAGAVLIDVIDALLHRWRLAATTDLHRLRRHLRPAVNIPNIVITTHSTYVHTQRKSASVPAQTAEEPPFLKRPSMET